MILDAFALLGLPRRGWLSPEDIRVAFQKAAAAVHPDTAADEGERSARTEHFQQLNQASTLLTPVTSRLKHFLALECPDFTPARAALMDEVLVTLFSTVGSAVQAAANWTRQRATATTFLAKAAVSAEEIRVQEILESAGAALSVEQEKLNAALRQFDVNLTDSPQAHFSAEFLSSLATRAAFLGKWQAQLQAAWSGLFSAS